MKDVQIIFRDDFDPEQLAATTTPFSYKGVSYEVDLTEENDAEFDEIMAAYIEVARVVTPEKRATRRRKTAVEGVKEQRRRIREWAGISGRAGVVAGDTIKAYAAANPDDPILPSTWPTYEGRKARSTEVLTADHGPIQSVSEVFGGRHVAGVKAAETARERAMEVGRFGLSDEKRAEIRKWVMENREDIGQAGSGQLKTAGVEAYYAAHPEETRD